MVPFPLLQPSFLPPVSPQLQHLPIVLVLSSLCNILQYPPCSPHRCVTDTDVLCCSARCHVHVSNQSGKRKHTLSGQLGDESMMAKQAEKAGVLPACLPACRILPSGWAKLCRLLWSPHVVQVE